MLILHYTQIVTIKSFKNVLPCPIWKLSLHYHHTNIDLIRQVINLFDLKKAFSNLEANDYVSLLIETIKNILENFIETVICDEKDPSWMTKRIKTILKKGFKRRTFCASFSEKTSKLTNQAAKSHWSFKSWIT